ncbi:unnamed protein product [Closterium sp. Naga37s-1]|nr:unnamed protein product [Closterium sp. Naga37s-1]
MPACRKLFAIPSCSPLWTSLSSLSHTSCFPVPSSTQTRLLSCPPPLLPLPSCPASPSSLCCHPLSKAHALHWARPISHGPDDCSGHGAARAAEAAPASTAADCLPSRAPFHPLAAAELVSSFCLLSISRVPLLPSASLPVRPFARSHNHLPVCLLKARPVCLQLRNLPSVVTRLLQVPFSSTLEAFGQSEAGLGIVAVMLSAQTPEQVGGAEFDPTDPFAIFAAALRVKNREAELPADTDSAGAVSARPATTLAPLPQHPPVRFNQDSTFFAYATHGGFRVFRCDQLKEILRREFEGRGVGMVEMLFSSSLLALVGGGPNPCYPPNKVRGGEERGVRRSGSPIAEKKVIIWDDKERRCIGELAFCSEVRGVRLRRDHIVVVLEHKILVYTFPGLKLVHQMETPWNPTGLCAVSQSPDNFVLACPAKRPEDARWDGGMICVELFEERRGYVRGASFSQPACMALSLDGKLLATASSKGTIIRVINTADGTRLHELRRGVERANIYSLAFSPKAPFLVAARVLPEKYFRERSLAFYRTGVHTHMLAAFGADPNTVIVVGSTGAYYKLQFDPQAGGEMKLLNQANFLATEDEH